MEWLPLETFPIKSCQESNRCFYSCAQLESALLLHGIASIADNRVHQENNTQEKCWSLEELVFLMLIPQSLPQYQSLISVD